MISVIIPCFNEGKKIKKNIEKIKKKLSKDYEVICVNDGSTDDTNEILKTIDGIKVIGYDKNRGKGYAVKYGIQHAKGDLIIFMDADLSTELSAIEFALKETADIVIGSRTNKDSFIFGKTFTRNLSSFVSNFIIRLITGIPFKDTQCGFKLFTREAANKLINLQTIDRWAFDVEYLYIAKLNNMKVVEIPVVWTNDRDSRVNLIKDSMIFLKETLKIRKNKKLYIIKE